MRGPDGRGEWYSNDERVGFGHRRPFGLWDARKRALPLARDPYGIKPLYYSDDGWTLRFASQVKALLAGGKVSPIKEPAFGHRRPGAFLATQLSGSKPLLSGEFIKSIRPSEDCMTLEG
jgi:asparagine synthetase B (glutamine-hydrolysing)